MGIRDPRVDAYIDKSQPFARPILQHLRTLVHAGCPDVEETMKWSFPHFVFHGILCSMASFKQHCAFGFWRASLLKARGTSADAMGQFGRITSIDDLPDRRTLTRLVREAAELNAKGVKVERTRRTLRRSAKAPADLMAALRKNRKAFATFVGFSPSKRRDYIEWITEAKGSDTRTRRVQIAVAWISQGKPRNWKYMTRR